MGIRTTTKTFRGETPFCLSFGTETIIPVEIELTSPQVENYDPNTKEELLRIQLDLLEELQYGAKPRMLLCKEHISQRYNARI